MRNKVILLILAALSVGIVLLAPLSGTMDIGLRELLSDSDDADMQKTVFWKIRVPRVLLAYLAGLGLSVCGMVFQAIFRNALATPFTLGVASGASLGTAIAMILGIPPLLGFSATSIFAFVGALATILIVFGIARLRGSFSNTTLVLTGVAISYFFSSLILLLQYLGDQHNVIKILRWIMGGLNVWGYGPCVNVFPFVAIGGLLIFFYTHHLNLLATGDDIATSRGIDVARSRKILFLVTSLVVGGIVAECGPIGFVGLMCPHIARLLVGADHRHLVPATMLFGGFFLTACDTLSGSLPIGYQLPVGILTSIMGGPFFLWLLLRRKREYAEFG